MSEAPLTRDELLALWRSLMPEGYATPFEFEAEGQGFDTVSGTAVSLERAADAVIRAMQAYYLRPHSTQTAPPASGAARATVVGRLERRAPSVARDVTLRGGTPVATSFRGPSGASTPGPLFELAEDVTIPNGVLDVPAPLRARRVGYVGNVRARNFVGLLEVGGGLSPVAAVSGNTIATSTAFDRVTRDFLGRFVTFPPGSANELETRQIVSLTVNADGSATVTVDGAPLAAETTDLVLLDFRELGLEVVVEDDASGGTSALLDAIGSERRIHRRLGESDDAYRDRISELADTVSPAAMIRIASRILAPLGIGFRFRETRDPDTWPGFILDRDPLDFGPIWSGLVDGCQIATAFALEVGLSDLGEFGAPYDATTGPVNALDVFALDGFPIGYRSALGALYDELREAKAAGVCFTLRLDPTL